MEEEEERKEKKRKERDVRAVPNPYWVHFRSLPPQFNAFSHLN